MGLVVSLTYKDGQTEAVRLGAMGLVAAERKYGSGMKGENSIEGTLYATWFVKGMPDGSFDEWLATIDDMEEEDAPVRPLDPAASPKGSQT